MIEVPLTHPALAVIGVLAESRLRERRSCASLRVVEAVCYCSPQTGHISGRNQTSHVTFHCGTRHYDPNVLNCGSTAIHCSTCYLGQRVVEEIGAHGGECRVAGVRNGF